ncbi:MAG: TetR/AcrR family transcriptional regulator [Bacteroidales bacterium]
MEQEPNHTRFSEIIEKSVMLFKNYGIRSVSMDDIARELGMSKKTLYGYVSNKADLIANALRMSTESFDEWMGHLRAQDLNAIDELLEVSKRVNEEQSKFNPSNLFELNKYYPQLLKDHVTQEKKLVYNYCRQNLLLGMEQGLYRDDLNVDLISELYIQKIGAIHETEFLEQEKFSFAKIFEVMFENHIRGIANENGIAYYEKRKQQLNFNQII